jgi:hypothetical protein
MRTQEQAFRAYYASMRDADLLAIAKNRRSFIPAENSGELARIRGLPAPPGEVSKRTTRPDKLFLAQPREGIDAFPSIHCLDGH